MKQQIKAKGSLQILLLGFLEIVNYYQEKQFLLSSQVTFEVNHIRVARV
jgi:hypothetical protein